jgi:hypothetical protein
LHLCHQEKSRHDEQLHKEQFPDDSSVSSFVLGEQVVENLCFDSTQVETCTLRYSQRYLACRMLKGVPR